MEVGFDAHGDAFTVVPDVAVVALDTVLVGFAGTATRGNATGVFDGTRVSFKISCKKEEREEVEEGGFREFFVEGGQSMGVFEDGRGVNIERFIREGRGANDS